MKRGREEQKEHRVKREKRDGRGRIMRRERLKGVTGGRERFLEGRNK